MSEEKSEPVSIDAILDRVAGMFQVNKEEICGKNRSANILDARKAAIYIVREVTDLSLKSIGEIFGNRDHSTILHSLNVVKVGMEKNPQYRNVIETAIRELKK